MRSGRADSRWGPQSLPRSCRLGESGRAAGGGPGRLTGPACGLRRLDRPPGHDDEPDARITHAWDRAPASCATPSQLRRARPHSWRPSPREPPRSQSTQPRPRPPSPARPRPPTNAELALQSRGLTSSRLRSACALSAVTAPSEPPAPGRSWGLRLAQPTQESGRRQEGQVRPASPTHTPAQVQKARKGMCVARAGHARSGRSSRLA